KSTEAQSTERPPLHPVRASARPRNADMNFMETPAKTSRTEDGDRGLATREFDGAQEDTANVTYDVCINVSNIDVDEDVPSTIWEAMRTPDANGWFEACMKEINNLQLMKCYKIVQKNPKTHPEVEMGLQAQSQTARRHSKRAS
ncbi:hypothetical protein H310_10789, partial [Aphanomyces invadans]